MRAGVHVMLLSAVLVFLGFWLAVVWYCDIDGFRARRRGRPACAAHSENPAAHAAIDPDDGDDAHRHR
jgi:hypothetical protein